MVWPCPSRTDTLGEARVLSKGVLCHRWNVGFWQPQKWCREEPRPPQRFNANTQNKVEPRVPEGKLPHWGPGGILQKEISPFLHFWNQNVRTGSFFSSWFESSLLQLRLNNIPISKSPAFKPPLHDHFTQGEKAEVRFSFTRQMKHAGLRFCKPVK